MYILTASSGPIKGRSWTIGEQGLLIGRGLSANVLVPDPTVSRKHCELTTDGETVRLRHLSDYNVTLVNGEPQRDCVLNEGAEMGVGCVTFLLTRATLSSVERPQKPDSGETRRFLGDILDGTTEGPSGGDGPNVRTVREMAEIFSIMRSLLQVKSLREFAAQLYARLHELLGVQEVCLARFFPGATNEATFYFDGPQGNSQHGMIPEEIIRKCHAKQSPAFKMMEKDLKGKTLTAVCAAPIAIADQRVGVLAIVLESPNEPALQEALSFLSVFVSHLGPLVLTVEQIDWLSHENEWLRYRAGEQGTLLGSSPAMDHVRELIVRFAPMQFPVLIHGETGTGKELVARALHDVSHRAQGPYVTVNCAAFQSTLFESEFFGHERGAFTGAEKARTGRLEQAHGGTLFLDEIAELNLDNQAKTLRAIELGRFHRVGSERETQVDVRIVAASNRKLEDAVAAGRFREDLLHRLDTFRIDIPPLRERTEDIPILAQHFLDIAANQGRKRIKGLDDDAVQHLKRQPLKGNARELRNLIERAVVFCQGDYVGLADLNATMTPPKAEAPAMQGPLRKLDDIENEYIDYVIRQCEGNVSNAAKALGIHRTTLHNKLAERKERTT
jgi:DNA-binding NtrC family response regulator